MEAEASPPVPGDWNKWLSQSARQADHVCYSMKMVASLPHERERVEGGLAHLACLESWLVHVRLLLEFLLIHPANKTKDFSARDFGWEGPQSADHQRLKNLWQVASSHLVHFSRERAAEDLYDLQAEDMSLAALIDSSTQLLAVAQEFVLHLEGSAQPEAGRFREALEHARSTLFRTG